MFLSERMLSGRIDSGRLTWGMAGYFRNETTALISGFR
jgi:hypothetical protein